MQLDDAAWSSPWRRRSVAEKALLCLGLLLVAATTGSPVIAAVVGLLVTGLALLTAMVPPGLWWRVLLGPAVFVAVGAVTVALDLGAATGSDVWRLGPVGMTTSGVETALLVSLRALAATSAMLLLAATTPMVEVLSALRRVGVPGPVVDVAAVMYRMIFGLLEAMAAIREAQAGRLGYASGRAARRSLGQLVAAVMVRAWTRASRLEDGLAGRGGVEAVPMVPARPVSLPFALAAVALVTVTATASLLVAL